MRQGNIILPWFLAKIWVLIFYWRWENFCSRTLLGNETPWTTLTTKDLTLMPLAFGREERGWKNIQGNNDRKLPRFCTRHKSTDARTWENINKINPKKYMSRPIRMKLLRAKIQTLESSQRKTTLYLKRTTVQKQPVSHQIPEGQEEMIQFFVNADKKELSAQNHMSSENIL